MSNNNKVKGLLKGLRYISQIFDNEKEPEMQIGYPTDVKHVAHIGWDGPSVNSPSWMNEFKSPTAYASAPLNHNGDAKEVPDSCQWISEDATRRSGRVPNSPSRDLPELPKASRRQKSTSGASSATEPPSREKVEKTRQRRSSRNASKETTTDSPRQSRRSMDSSSGVESPARNLPEIPKKNRRKKSKDGGGSSSRSRSKAPASPSHDQFMAAFSDPGPDPKSDKSKGNERNCQQLSIFDEADEADEADEIKGLIS